MAHSKRPSATDQPETLYDTDNPYRRQSRHFWQRRLGLWLSHRQWHRSALGMIGPTLVLGALGWLGGDGWPGSLLTVGLGLMLSVSVWDLLWPTNRRCAPDGCELPAARN